MMDEVVKSVHPEICIGQTDATLCTSHPVLLPPGKPAISISSIITEIPSFLLVQLCAAIEFFFFLEASLFPRNVHSSARHVGHRRGLNLHEPPTTARRMQDPQ